MDRGSKRLVAGGVAAAGAMLVMAGAVIGAGLAKADPDNGPFSGPMGDHSASALSVDTTEFMSGDVDDAENMAVAVCRQLEQGHSEGELIAVGVKATGGSVSDLRYVVHAIEWHYCPDKY